MSWLGVLLAAGDATAYRPAMGFSIPLDASAPLLRITAEQLGTMAGRGAFVGLPRLELCDGILCEVSPQNLPHLRAKMAIIFALHAALRALGLALDVASEGSVRIGEHDVPMPDVFIWAAQPGRGLVQGEHVRLVVEISETTLSDDLGRKRRVYAAGGIPEYWVVDLGNQIVHQFWAPAEDAYAGESQVSFGRLLASATLPGLSLDTATLRDGT